MVNPGTFAATTGRILSLIASGTGCEAGGRWYSLYRACEPLGEQLRREPPRVIPRPVPGDGNRRGHPTRPDAYCRLEGRIKKFGYHTACLVIGPRPSSPRRVRPVVRYQVANPSHPLVQEIQPVHLYLIKCHPKIT